MTSIFDIHDTAGYLVQYPDTGGEPETSRVDIVYCAGAERFDRYLDAMHLWDEFYRVERLLKDERLAEEGSQ